MIVQETVGWQGLDPPPMPPWEAAARAIGQMPQETLELGALPLLKHLEPDALEYISVIARRNTYRADQIIVLEGDPCSTVHVILSGFVRVRQLSLEGREHVLAYLGPGRAFGVVPALDGDVHLATIDALSDTTTLGIPCEAFAEFARENPALLAAIADGLAAEVRRLTSMLKDMALHTVRARLARFLLTHAENHPPHRRWTQEMIAANIGTVRDVVGRLLRDLRSEGIIRRERGRLVVVDRDALEQEALDT